MEGKEGREGISALVKQERECHNGVSRAHTETARNNSSEEGGGADTVAINDTLWDSVHPSFPRVPTPEPTVRGTEDTVKRFFCPRAERAPLSQTLRRQAGEQEEERGGGEAIKVLSFG